ncbi:hypothetical protein PR202_ga17930 [Eleusine coracana subsp. coracana]|uniref:Uncharacterized protein n=1 Tax=Eleusine coracana subsp. coracana TaxID=191504 RepID=A0AAV5CRR5_ELECO|nr:hypothetical protein PR202_ga17930 [Eleusine coracana subsp. coracana]
MGVSEGRLRYAEVSREEPFVLRSFVLNNDRVSWTLERRMELSRLWVHGGRQRKEDAPHIAVLDPLNANVIHITVGNVAFAVDMDKEKVLGCSTSPIDEGARRIKIKQQCVTGFRLYHAYVSLPLSILLLNPV